MKKLKKMKKRILMKMIEEKFIYMNNIDDIVYIEKNLKDCKKYNDYKDIKINLNSFIDIMKFLKIFYKLDLLNIKFNMSIDSDDIMNYYIERNFEEYLNLLKEECNDDFYIEKIILESDDLYLILEDNGYIYLKYSLYKNLSTFKILNILDNITRILKGNLNKINTVIGDEMND